LELEQWLKEQKTQQNQKHNKNASMFTDINVEFFGFHQGTWARVDMELVLSYLQNKSPRTTILFADYIMISSNTEKYNRTHRRSVENGVNKYFRVSVETFKNNPGWN